MVTRNLKAKILDRYGNRSVDSAVSRTPNTQMNMLRRSAQRDDQNGIQISVVRLNYKNSNFSTTENARKTLKNKIDGAKDVRIWKNDKLTSCSEDGLEFSM